MVNYGVIQGRLTRDPETKDLGNDTSVTVFGIAHNKKIGDKERTGFYEVKCFGVQGKNIQRFFKKGRPILLEYELDQETWQSEGENRSKVVIKANNWHFVDEKKS